MPLKGRAGGIFAVTRLRELIDEVRQAHPQDQFFRDFDKSCRQDPVKRRHYRTYADALRVLDAQSWRELKNKALQHYLNHRKGQLKQGFFNQLNDAFAYRHLRQRGCTAVQVLHEGKTRTPDIRYSESGSIKHCEVKTLGISCDEIDRRCSGEASDGQVYAKLGAGFLNKFHSSFDVAKKQIAVHPSGGLVYFVVIFDDTTYDYYEDYRRQILSYCRQKGMRDLYVKVGLRGNRRISV